MFPSCNLFPSVFLDDLGPFYFCHATYVSGLSPHRNCSLEIGGLWFECKCVFPYTRTSDQHFNTTNTWFMVLFLSLPINALFCTQKQAEKEKCKMVQKPWLRLLADASLLLPGMSSLALVPVPQLPLDFSFFQFCCLFVLPFKHPDCGHQTCTPYYWQITYSFTPITAKSCSKHNFCKMVIAEAEENCSIKFWKGRLKSYLLCSFMMSSC